MRNRLVRVAVAVFLPFFLGACAHNFDKIVLSGAGQQISAEVARSDWEREHGLMGRTRLGAHQGMLFVFGRDEHLEFWMKNTPLPLSIAFISAEGKVLEIRDMLPFDLRTVRSKFSARYALEMNQGAFRKLGIAEGDFLTFPAGFLQP